MTTQKGILILFGALIALLLVLGGTVAIAQAIDLGDGAAGAVGAAAIQDEGDTDSPGYHGFGEGKHRFHQQLEGITPMDELLAAQLDISVDALHDAMVEAHAAAREQAEADGYFHGHGYGGRRGEFGDEYLSLLAEALDIPVEELEAAQAAAREAFLAELLEAGVVTQEQIDMMEARRALSETINRDALLAEALGMDLAELEAAREDGASLRELLDEMSVEEFAAAYEAAYEAAVRQAAADGVITDAQAEEILSSGFGFGHGHGLGHHHFGSQGGPRGFGPGQRSPDNRGISL